MSDRSKPCGFPSEEGIADQDGLHENHFYIDIRWLNDDGRFEERWELEEELLAY